MPPQGELQCEASQPLQGGHSGPFHCHCHKVALVSGEDPGGLYQQLVYVLEEQEVNWLELCILIVPVQKSF